LIIEQLVVGPLETNCYVVADEKTAVAAVIDPGGDVEDILAQIRKMAVHVAYVINTHGHFDHMAGNGGVIAATKAKLAIHRGDAALLAQGGGASMFGIGDISSPPPDLFLEDGDLLGLGETELLVIHTPGHSPGGIALYSRTHAALFCGDCLFYAGIGRTDLPGGDYDTLIASLTKILALPRETLVYPGHGPSTTIGHEKAHNPFLR
jgi:glyoxylase-like metal-dependent hydrolase (beta-lactamase superfamily II)